MCGRWANPGFGQELRSLGRIPAVTSAQTHGAGWGWDPGQGVALHSPALLHLEGFQPVEVASEMMHWGPPVGAWTPS